MRNLFALMLSAAAVFAQNTPRVNLDSLMNLQFYPAGKGRFRVEGLSYIFPQGVQKGRIVLTKNGKVTGSNDIVGEPRPETPFAQAFGVINAAPTMPAGFFDADGPGDYTMSVELGGAKLGSYSFRLEAQASADPFAAAKGLSRSGPWPKTAVLGRAMERPNEPLRVGAWFNVRDLPGYQAGKQTPFTAQITRGGKELAFVEGIATDEDWVYYSLVMMQGTRAAKGPFTWSDLTKAPGDYAFVIRVKGVVAKEFPFKVAGGTMVRIPQNELSYSGPDALAPQGVQLNQGTYMREERYWLAPVR